MRTLLSGILILLVAGGFAVWPQEVSGQECPYGRTDCGDVTCHRVGSGTSTAYGGCLNSQQFVGYDCRVQWGHAASGGTGNKVRPARVMCSPGGINFSVVDCGDMYIAAPATPDACNIQWHGCGGIMVDPC